VHRPAGIVGLAVEARDVAHHEIVDQHRAARPADDGVAGLVALEHHARTAGDGVLREIYVAGQQERSPLRRRRVAEPLPGVAPVVALPERQRPDPGERRIQRDDGDVLLVARLAQLARDRGPLEEAQPHRAADRRVLDDVLARHDEQLRDEVPGPLLVPRLDARVGLDDLADRPLLLLLHALASRSATPPPGPDAT
jgi:hypothetical protein